MSMQGNLPAPLLILDADQGIEKMLETYEKFTEEIRGKKPYTPVKSTVEPKKVKADGNSGKENPGKEFDEKENKVTENIATVNIENEKTCKEGGQRNNTKSVCGASKKPLESQDTNVKAS